MKKMNMNGLFIGRLLVLMSVMLTGTITAYSQQQQEGMLVTNSGRTLQNFHEITVSVDLKQASLPEIFRLMEELTGLRFMYNKKVIEKSVHRLDVELSQVSAADVLREVGAQTGLAFRQINRIVSVNVNDLREPQSEIPEPVQFEVFQSVSGVVTDAQTGEVLPGVNIQLQGTARGTTTDQNGEFQLEIPDPSNDVLIFSFIGYETYQVEIDGRSNIDVRLSSDVSQLGEMVVIGYGEQRRSRVIGSVGSIDRQSIEGATGIVSPEQVIQGRISGVNVTTNSGIPGQGFRVDIRGNASITGSNEPLYVIDGVPVSGESYDRFNFGIERESPIAHISPSDIESIEILKDASATAIYGSRATNGVVLITTKRGREGSTQIDFSSNVDIGNAPKRVHIASSDAYFEVMNEARQNYNQDNGLSPGDLGFEPPLHDPREPGHVDTDWFELVTREQALTENYNLSVSGGDERTRFYTSGTYMRNQGIIKSNQFQRISGRLNVDHRASDRLSLRANIGLSQTVNNRIQNEGSGRGLLVRTLEQRPYDTPYKEGGSYNIGGVDILRHNGVQIINEQDVSLTGNRAIFDASGTFDILQGLQYQAKVGGEYGFTHEYVHFTDMHPRGGAGGVVHDWRTINQNILIENTLHFDHVFGHDFHISGLLGHTFQRFERERSNLEGHDFPSSSFGYITSAGRIQGGWSDWTSYVLESFISRVNLNYDERYMLSATLRRDGSSKFLGDNRYGVFPSVSAGWRISREPFFNIDNLISDLRIRMSYGQTGNQDGIGNFVAIPGAVGGQSYRQNTGMAITSEGNPDLTWEIASQFNMGLDVGLFRGRLTITTDYFIQNTNDLLYNLPLHTTTGFSSSIQNIGSMSNKGFEFALRTVNMDGLVSWNTDFNISFIRNQLTSLVGDELIPIGDHVLKEGEPLGTFYMLRQIGIYQHNDEVPQTLYDEGVRAGDIIYEDVNGDGRTTSADRQVVGTANPDFYGGITNSFSYRNFDFSAFISFKYGNKVLNTWAQRLDSFGRYEYALREDNIDKRWTGPGTSNKQPRPALGTYNTQMSTRFLEDASYVRLQNITLGYTIPQQLASRMNIRRIRVYLAGTNLITLTGYSGMDPEVSRSLNPSQLGEDFFNVPQLRSFTLGINVGF